MKKKIILMLCVFALFVCVFAISVSASEYVFITSDGGSISGNVSVDMSSFNDVVIWFVTYDNGLAFSPYDFKLFVTEVIGENATYSQWFSYCDANSAGSESIFTHWAYDSDILNEAYFNKLYYYEAPPTEEDLQAKYIEGYNEGVNNFKSSEAYKNELELEYNSGLIDGKNKYIASNEYEAALESEYDKGYEAAEQIEKNGSGLNWLVASLLLILPGGIVLLIFSHVRKKKRKR